MYYIYVQLCYIFIVIFNQLYSYMWHATFECDLHCVQMLYLGSALGLYFPWDFCLFPGMSALVSFAPRLIPLSVATSVSIAALLAIFRCFKKSYM